jgi:hypothetical protein
MALMIPESTIETEMTVSRMETIEWLDDRHIVSTNDLLK